MTNEEAIEVLAQDLPCENDEDLSEAMTMAIKALEQQEKSEYEHDHEVVKAYNDGQAYILDKIRAEIEEIKLNVDLDIGNEMIYNNAIKDVLEIIDKYRGE